MTAPKIPGVRRKIAKGRAYWYLEARGQRQRLPAPSAPDFALALSAAQRGEIYVAEAGRDFRQLVAIYRQSRKWTKLAPRTRRDYERVLAWVIAKIGKLKPAQMRRIHVIRAVAENSRRERFADYIRQMLSILFETAIDLGWIDHNPAKGVPSIKGKREPVHRPWPEEMIASFVAEAGPTERLILELAIGTGQRIGDLLRMRWDQITPNGIILRQGKTGQPMTIPLTKRLADQLAQQPRAALTIIAGKIGRPLSYDAARKRVARVRARAGAEGLTIHGWRYTAANQLAAAGCSDEEIQAITGHKTSAMIRLYAGSARQIAHAQAAQNKREG